MMNVIRIEPGSRFSQAVIAGELVFVSGQVAADATQDIAGQMRQALGAVRRP